MSTETNIDYGEIKNISTGYTGIDRHGDYGRSEDNYLFVFSIDYGWKPMFPDKCESHYWKKKYTQLIEKQ